MSCRIDWLQQGSREIFGTVIEDKIYFLIDTSASMSPHMEFVKDKLFVLMQVKKLKFKGSFILGGTRKRKRFFSLILVTAQCKNSIGFSMNPFGATSLSL